jgi:hypothetical protein
MNMSETQWARFLTKALDATAAAWSAGQDMPVNASNMFYAFDQAWDLLVRGDVEGAAKLTAPFGYPRGAMNNQARLMAQERQKGYVPPSGMELIKRLVYDYSEQYKTRKADHKKDYADKTKMNQQIKELVGSGAAIGLVPASDSNYVVSLSYQPVDVDVLDPELSEEDLATLIEWVEAGVKMGSTLYYDPVTRRLTLVSKDIRTARRTGWDK